MTPAARFPGRGQARAGHGWQIILADLALILFVMTLSALPAAEVESGKRLADSKASEREARGLGRRAQIAAAQAIYRAVPGGPGLGAWLASQQPDPRATLTIFATHRTGGEAGAWARAEALANEARSAGTPVRTIISAGESEELYASLAYDQPLAVR